MQVPQNCKDSYLLMSKPMNVKKKHISHPDSLWFHDQIQRRKKIHEAPAGGEPSPPASSVQVPGQPKDQRKLREMAPWGAMATSSLNSLDLEGEGKRRTNVIMDGRCWLRKRDEGFLRKLLLQLIEPKVQHLFHSLTGGV